TGDTAPAFDFGGLPDPGPASQPGVGNVSASGGAFDFGGLPEPGPASQPGVGDAAPAFDFGDLPSAVPGGAAPAPAFDFGDLPDPGQAPSLDFGAPVDAPSFDFTAPPPAADVGAPANPDLSVDFGAVDLGGGGPALDLDGIAGGGFATSDAAAGTGGYSVRRRSGKVFGPFESPAI